MAAHQSIVCSTPTTSNDTRPASTSGVYCGGGLACAGFGNVGKRAPPPAAIRSAMPVPITNDPMSVSRLPRSLTSLAGMTGTNRSNDAPQPMVLFDDCAGGGVKALTLNWRVTPEMPSDSGAATVMAFPGVVMPFQPLTVRRTPPWMSGTIESRCAGRAASMATSTETGPPAPNVRDILNCALRDDTWFGMPSSENPR